MLIYPKADCLQYKTNDSNNCYRRSFSLRKTKALRHNLNSATESTKQGTSPLDASDTEHTNRFQIYGGTKWKTEKSTKIDKK